MKRAKPVLLLAAIAVLSATISIGVSWQLNRTLLYAAQKDQRQATSAIANELQSRMIEVMAKDISLINGVRALIEAYPGISQEEYRAYARSIKAFHPAIRNIAAAPDLVVRFVYPYAENKSVIGLDYRTAPIEQRDAVSMAISENRVVVAGPVTLVQGGEALILRAPVFPSLETGQSELWGIVAVPIDMQTVYAQLGIPDLQQDYEIAIRGKDGQGAKGAVFFGEERLFSNSTDSLQYPISLGQGSWVLAMLPKGGWVQTSPHQNSVVFGNLLLFAVLSLLGWVILWNYQEKLAIRTDQIRTVREKEEFLEILSHEIRSPLQGVLAAQKYLLKHGIAEDLKPIVRSASQAGDYILDLINDYLDLQRADSNRLADNSSSVQIRPMLNEVVSIVTVGEREGAIPVHLEIADDVPKWLRLDRKKVQQILMNLVSNALKFTSEGEIHVRVQLATEGSDFDLQLIIEDTGIGIEPEELDKLFDRFTRTRGGETTGGSGLGLAITRMLVKVLDGKISVESEVAKGTRFTVTLPTSEDEKAAAGDGYLSSEEQPSRVNYARLKAMTVVVADDVKVNSLLLKAMLSPVVKEVIMVESGQQVLDIIQGRHVDAIVTDINMPGMSGLEVAHHAKSNPDLSAIRIIGLTGEDLQGHSLGGDFGDLDCLLNKPIDLEPLLEVLVDDHPSDDISAAG